MSYQVEFSYSPINELINSFFTYTCKTTLRRSDREKAWSKEVGEKLDHNFAFMLKEDEFVPKMSKLGFVHFLVQSCPNHQDVSGFISWLEGLSGGDIYEILTPYMKQFPYDLNLVRDKFVYYLQGWNESYFQHVDQGILERLQAEFENRQQLVKEELNLPFFIEEVTNGLYFEEEENLKKVILTPQFHASPGNWLYPFDGVTLCHYAFDAQYQHNSEEPPAILKEGAKALSDLNRLKILRLLRNESKSFIEVVRHLDIAKSTAYEHTIVLRAAGLVRSHVVGDTAVSYSLRKEGFSRLKEEISEWIK